MEQRIDMLEREVGAIKADIAVIKSTYCMREEMRAFESRLARVESDICILKNVVQQPKKDAVEIKLVLVEIRAELAQIWDSLQHFVTKADLLKFEARLKIWIFGSIFSSLTLMTAIQFGLYIAFVK